MTLCHIKVQIRRTKARGGVLAAGAVAVVAVAAVVRPCAVTITGVALGHAACDICNIAYT